MSNLARTDAVSPHELARTRGLFVGEIPITAFPRLNEIVLADGSVRINLAFARDDEGFSRVQGVAVFAPTLECQRCLEPIERALEVKIDLCIVNSPEQAAELAEELDTFELTEDDVSIVDLLEDDLLLALPSQVCEAYDACPNRPDLNYPANKPAALQQPPRRNPFGVLAGLKKRDD